MKNRILLLLYMLMLAFTITGCGKGNETTMTGIVVSVDGTVVSLQEFSAEMMEQPANGSMPDVGNFEGFENFNPEDFNPEDFEGSMPQPPEGAQIPNMPEGGEMPEGEEMPDFASGFSGGESTTIDLADAHISVEIDSGKASGSMEDIVTGSLLTITINEKGKATNVVVSSLSGFNSGNS
jgi:hypothetical protein